MIKHSIIDTIGNTPLIQLERINPNIYAKAELFNPAGSAKDRAALYMIREAEAAGLKAGGTLIAPTSGNTGIGLCAVGSVMGYRAVIVLPDNMSEERIKLIKAYGGEVVMTPAALGMKGAIDEADRLEASLDNAVVIRQFDSEANANAHYETTGPEIYGDLPEADIFVAGIGTGGTITGVARYLKEKNPAIEIIGVEPADSPLITEGRAGAHKLQGIGANFIPKVLDPGVIDRVLTATTEEAFEGKRLLSQKEGLLVGISGGAAFAAAQRVAMEKPEAKLVVLLPDTGERYLSVNE